VQSVKARLIALAFLAASPLILMYEGVRYEPYRDPVGIVTVCEGHTGPDIVWGKQYTKAECAEFKRKDMLAANAVVDSCITAPLTPTQRGALISFALNVGHGGKGVKDGLCRLKSGAVPTITRLFNAGQPIAACNELPKWNAQKLPGITKRREAERKLCLSSPTSGNAPY
jgi:lysozyme